MIFEPTIQIVLKDEDGSESIVLIPISTVSVAVLVGVKVEEMTGFDFLADRELIAPWVEGMGEPEWGFVHQVLAHCGDDPAPLTGDDLTILLWLVWEWLAETMPYKQISEIRDVGEEMHRDLLNAIGMNPN